MENKIIDLPFGVVLAPLLGNGDEGSIPVEMLIIILSQLTFGDKRPIRGGCELGSGGGRELGSEGGPAESSGLAGAMGMTIELGRHLTVTRPVDGSDRNHSDRCLILSVCLWCT